jgi:hypothetical protein
MAIGLGTVVLLLGGIAAIAFFGFTATGKNLISGITNRIPSSTPLPPSTAGGEGGRYYTPQQIEDMVMGYAQQVAADEDLQEYILDRMEERDDNDKRYRV